MKPRRVIEFRLFLHDDLRFCWIVLMMAASLWEDEALVAKIDARPVILNVKNP